jgi:hypothetical protein
VEPVAVGVVANMCEGELILCFANMQLFLQFFEISGVSNGEWVAQKLIFVQQVHPSHSLLLFR